MTELNNQPHSFRQTIEPSSRSWINSVILGLGILLLVGGIVLGMRQQNSTVIGLPEYSPIFISPADSLSVEASPASGAEETNLSAVAEITPSPIIETSPTGSVPIVDNPPAKVKGVATSQTLPVPKSNTETQRLPVAVTIETSANAKANLPIYQPVEVLPDFSPAFVSPSPSQTVSLVVSGQTYSVQIQSGMTVLAVIQAATKQGLTYRLQEFSGLGSMIVELNGQAQGNNRYWTYAINGAFATKGVSSQTVNANDQIVWTLS